MQATCPLHFPNFKSVEVARPGYLWLRFAATSLSMSLGCFAGLIL